MDLLLAALLAVAPGGAGETWTVLFDGRSTDAWRGYRRDGFPAGCWKVEGGALKTVPHTVAADTGCDIITKERFRDFELTLEYKLGKGGNSGVLYRVAELPPPAPIWHSGPELQILDDATHEKANPNTLTGSLYDLVAPENKTVRPLGEWNAVRLVVRGSHVEHWLNGTKVLEYTLGSGDFARRVAASKFRDMPRFGREAEGHLGLQHHGEEAWFKDIRVRRLGANEKEKRR
jgi:hypothetical protein